MRKFIVLAAMVALLSVACRAEMNMGFAVEEDGSSSVRVEFGADEEFAGLLELGGGDPLELFGTADLGIDGAEATQRTEGDMTFWGFTKSYDDYNDMLAEIGDGSTADNPLAGIDFVMDSDGAVLSGQLEIPQEDLGEIPFDPSELTNDIFAFNFIFSMPGTVTEHNADEVLTDGGLLWTIPITGGTVDIAATSTLNEGGALWWLWILLGVVLVVGLAAAIVAIVLGRRQSRQAVADAAAQYPQQVPAYEGADQPVATETEESPPSNDGERAPDPVATPDDDAAETEPDPEIGPERS